MPCLNVTLPLSAFGLEELVNVFCGVAQVGRVGDRFFEADVAELDAEVAGRALPERLPATTCQ